jgi:hypothetical protein
VWPRNYSPGVALGRGEASLCCDPTPRCPKSDRLDVRSSKTALTLSAEDEGYNFTSRQRKDVGSTALGVEDVFLRKGAKGKERRKVSFTPLREKPSEAVTLQFVCEASRLRYFMVVSLKINGH